MMQPAMIMRHVLGVGVHMYIVLTKQLLATVAELSLKPNVEMDYM